MGVGCLIVGYGACGTRRGGSVVHHAAESAKGRRDREADLEAGNGADGDATRERGVLDVRRGEAAAHEAREGKRGNTRGTERDHGVGDCHVAVLLRAVEEEKWGWLARMPFKGPLGVGWGTHPKSRPPLKEGQ